MLMKRCSKCQIEKPVTQFNIDNQKIDGLACICRYCKKISNDTSYKAKK